MQLIFILLVILEYLGLLLIEPGKISTPVVFILLLVHALVFIGYTILYPNKE